MMAVGTEYESFLHSSNTHFFSINIFLISYCVSNRNWVREEVFHTEVFEVETCTNV